MPTISIQATDTLFFRDGRPFSMGEETFAQGLFPPPPSVLYGSLRSSFISDQIESGNTKGSAISSSDNLKINGIYFRAVNPGDVSGTVWHPMPLDLIVPKTGKEDKAIPLLLFDKPKLSTTLLPKVLQSPTDEKTIDGQCLMNKWKFAKYLNGEKEEFNISKLSDYVNKEHKIGIGRDSNSHV